MKRNYSTLVLTSEHEIVVCLVDDSYSIDYWRELFINYMTEIVDEKMDITKYDEGIIEADDVLRDQRFEFIEKLQSNPHIKVLEVNVIDFCCTQIAELDFRVERKVKEMKKTKIKKRSEGGIRTEV